MSGIHDSNYWMRKAIALARLSEAQGEVPVGAVLVLNNECIGEGFNQSIGMNDPTAHAEIIALRKAGEACQNYRFPGASMYVTLEPCCMCSGALIHARISKLIFAAWDRKTGAAGSQFSIVNSTRHNHCVAIESGVLADECGALLSDFFKKKRR